MLRIYPVVLETLTALRGLIAQIERRDSDLSRQLRRAAASIVLNLGEGMYSIKSTQLTLYQEARRWLGSRSAEFVDAASEDHERGNRVVRRLFIGDVTADPTSANWTMYWVNDNLTWNEVRTTDGWTIGGDTRLPDWSHPGFGRSGGLCRLDTTTLANGKYTVQLRLQLTNGTLQRDWAVIEVKN